MYYKTFRPFILLAILILILGQACGGGVSAPGSSQVVKEDIRTYWSNTVALENAAEADWLSMLTKRSEGLSNIKNQNPLIDRCFVNSGQTLADAVSGRYDQRDPATDQPTGQIDAGLLINALVVNEAYPDISECQRLITKIANDITAWRMGNIDAFNKLWDDKEDLDTAYRGALDKAIVNELLAFAGTEFMKTDLAQWFAPPRIWFPTFNLEAFLTDETLCDYAKEDYPGQARWNRTQSRCQLIGQAAYDEIFTPILAAEIYTEVNTNVDSSDPVAVPTTVP